MIEEYFEEYPVSYLCPRVTIKKGRCDGRPCVRGTEITVESIAMMAADGATQQDVLKTYSQLTLEDLKDVYLYYLKPYQMFENLETNYANS